ncbi:MAG: SIS domain-containing protein [Chloroflexota bacterium]|nr:MAG: glucosamine-6-phosphate deaminase [Chloroflexota bacterium]
MAADIREQPSVFERILRQGVPRIAEVAAIIRTARPKFVLLAARGSSDHAALYAKYLLETRLGLAAGLVSPSTATIYDAHPDLHGVLFLALSQSGSSPDLVELVIRARSTGAVKVAITNAPDSPLSQAAQYSLDILAGPEEAVPATKTYTAELLTLYLLTGAIAEQNDAEVELIPEEAKRVLTSEPDVEKIAARYRFAEQIVVTSRGFNYSTAREAALKLMETTYLVAHGFSSADLLHGPMAMIHRGFPVIAIVPQGPAGLSLRPILEHLRTLWADVLIVGDGALCALATVCLPVPISIREQLSPILLAIPLQQFTWHLARQRGIDPDQPRGLRKITETW